MRTMKRSNLIIAILALLTVACQPKVDRFTLNGQIAEADGKTLYLDHMGLDKVEVIDSVKLDAEGKFCFNPVAPEDCFDFYRLRIDGKVVNLAIDSTETVTVTASLPVMQIAYMIEGSENSVKLKELVMSVNRTTVSKEEFLSDNVYVYRDDEISICA